MLALSKTVYKNKIRIAINRHLAGNSSFLLILSLLYKSSLDCRSHRHNSISSFRFGCINSVQTTFLPVAVINQRVIYTDFTRIKVDVLPAQTRCLTSTETTFHHHGNDRKPVIVLLTVFQEVHQQLLLACGQSLAVFAVQVVRLLQLFQRIIGWIDAEILVLNRKIQHLMQHCMDVLHRCHFQTLRIHKAVVKPPHIRLFQASDLPLSKLRKYIHLVHILVIDQRIGFQPLFQLQPLLVNVIDGRIPRFCTDAITAVALNLCFFSHEVLPDFWRTHCCACRFHCASGTHTFRYCADIHLPLEHASLSLFFFLPPLCPPLLAESNLQLNHTIPPRCFQLPTSFLLSNRK